MNRTPPDLPVEAERYEFFEQPLYRLPQYREGDRGRRQGHGGRPVEAKI